MKSKLVSVFSLLLYGSFLQVAAQNKVFNFTGKVVDQSGRGISDVVVNDGIHFTKTNGQGVWNLYSDTTVRNKYEIKFMEFCSENKMYRTQKS